MEGMLQLLAFGPDGWGDELASGLVVTVSLAFATLPLGLAAGFAVALAKQSPEKSLRMAANIYTTIFRGLPELLTLFLVFYGAQLGIQRVVAFFSPGASIEINAFVAGMVALGAVFSAYASEVFLSAFRAIPQGQYEAGHAIGLTNWQTMRLVILPQLIRLALPGLSNLWLILVKDTALVSVIGLSDVIRQAGIAARVSREAFLFFGVACLIYLGLAILSSVAFVFIERWAGKTEPAR
ncbi:MAG: ABC transporter permease [Aquamicrobium sp.]|uniref:ABC transporter permease n=1 Tax=Aquamicrobium sp. TaxID=1872579 RepID=UPI00349EF74A|nr:ABC transporter permease [Aquamicrobium sp.]